MLQDVSNYLLDLGGKRVRPLLTILSAKLFGMHEASQELLSAAAGIELIHMATLLHDDIIDESPLRRSQASAYSKYGTARTLLAGDFLFARAFGLCGVLDSEVVKATEQAVVELTEGEVLEGTLAENPKVNLERYLSVVSRKTASLFSLSAFVGAHLAGSTESQKQALFSFGRDAGIAFQMIDDILDIVSDSDLLGKPAGADLRQKTPSLVNILWLSSGDPLATEFFAKDSTEDELKAAMAHIKSTDVLAESRKIAAEYAAKARGHLENISDKELDLESRDNLFALVNYTLTRCL